MATHIVQKKGTAPTTPTRDLVDPFEVMDRMIDSFFGRGLTAPLSTRWPELGELQAQMPRVDLIEHENDVTVKAELPGYTKDEVEITLDDDLLTLRGETKEEKKEEDKEGRYHRSEIRRGSFVRSLQLPSAVKAEEAKANFKDGVLEIVLPKAEVTKRHKIEVAAE